MVKRIGSIWDKVTSMDNLRLAYKNARKDKTTYREVIKIDQNPDFYLEQIRSALVSKTWKSSSYTVMYKQEGPKLRKISKLPFFPDRIIHWAIIQALEKMFTHNLIDTCYASLPNRGTHSALMKLREYLKNDDTQYVLKLDVRHFFENVDKDILMKKLERRIKDKDVLWCFHEIIYGYPDKGLPIGTYTSQYLANFYLSDLDHFMKEKYHCKYYLRYMDDMIVLGWDKKWLHRVKRKVEQKLAEDGLELNPSWQVSPIEDRGVNFVGYRAFHGYSLLRARTKRRMKRKLRTVVKELLTRSLDKHLRGIWAAYRGILQWCDGHHLYCQYVLPIDRLIDYGNIAVTERFLPRISGHRPHSSVGELQGGAVQRGA